MYILFYGFRILECNILLWDSWCFRILGKLMNMFIIFSVYVLFCVMLKIFNVGCCSGYNVISVICGSIKFVFCLMVVEMKEIVNIFV